VSGALSSGGGLAHLTAGYSLVTWLVVANLGFTGLLVSWVMKFADSIMKVGFVQTTTSMVLDDHVL
jgi:solute carrier family 35 (UDP-sugar transporter), member A1/2/3